MVNQRARTVASASLRRRIERLQAELESRGGVEKELRAALKAKTPKGWRSWLPMGQLPAILTALAAVGALLFTGVGLLQNQAATAEQSRLAEAGQITDRFNAAMTNLGSEGMTIRLGGIYALQRIMNDSPVDQPVIVQVLTAFIRSQSTASKPGPPSTTDLSIDIQDAVRVLARRDPEHDELARIDLRGVKLGGMYLDHPNLDGAYLMGANLSDAHLAGAHLSGVSLADANLSGADLTNANLSGTDLTNANLSGANLYGTLLCTGPSPTEGRGYRCDASPST